MNKNPSKPEPEPGHSFPLHTLARRAWLYWLNLWTKREYGYDKMPIVINTFFFYLFTPLCIFPISSLVHFPSFLPSSFLFS